VGHLKGGGKSNSICRGCLVKTQEMEGEQELEVNEQGLLNSSLPQEET